LTETNALPLHQTANHSKSGWILWKLLKKDFFTGRMLFLSS